MLSQDDTTRTTGPVERLPRTPDRRAILTGRRQSILQQKHTDPLPSLPAETSSMRGVWRHILSLREENRLLRRELDELRTGKQQPVTEPTTLQGLEPGTLQENLAQDAGTIHNNYNQKIEQYQAQVQTLTEERDRLQQALQTLQEELTRGAGTVDSGYQQEIEQYQAQVQALTEERNRLQQALQALERRYQELYSNFQDAVDEEAEKKVTNAARTLELSDDEPPVLLHDVMKTVELHVRKEHSRELVEANYYKRELMRMTELLEQEREQVEIQRQQLQTFQQRLHEQVELRRKGIEARLRTRWTTGVTFVATCGVVALVILQCLFLLLFGIRLEGLLEVAVFAPIIVCIVLSAALAHPFSMLKHIRESAPHKR